MYIYIYIFFTGDDVERSAAETEVFSSTPEFMTYVTQKTCNNLSSYHIKHIFKLFCSRRLYNYS